MLKTACRNSKYFGFYRTCKIADLELEMYLLLLSSSSSSFFRRFGSPGFIQRLFELARWNLVCLFVLSFPMDRDLLFFEIPIFDWFRTFWKLQHVYNTTPHVWPRYTEQPPCPPCSVGFLDCVFCVCFIRHLEHNLWIYFSTIAQYLEFIFRFF